MDICLKKVDSDSYKNDNNESNDKSCNYARESLVDGLIWFIGLRMRHEANALSFGMRDKTFLFGLRERLFDLWRKI